MKIFSATFISMLSFCFIQAQNPTVKQWDYRFGGTDREFLRTFQQTSDGAFILGGFSSSSISGDKTQDTYGGYDYWIVKIDSLGTKQWDKVFGGLEDERLYAIQQTIDGGYILGGTSSSGISGNKTQPNWDSINFSHDFWIVKIDSLGIMQWDKDFGGTNDDYIFSLQQTTDGGYIFGGNSNSGLSGDKTQANWDSVSYTNDFWLIRTDSLGNKVWDKVIGGTGNDELAAVKQTSDGGFVMAGLTLSGIGGDKTEANKGQMDYWLVKIDSAGNKIWDKDFGGTDTDLLSSMAYTADDGCILAGISNSGISGDKSQPNWDNSNLTFDYWLVKVDSTGSKQWDKVIGGTIGEPQLGNISQTKDGGYLVAGISYSSISGDKTENNLGIEQTWVVKTNAQGAVQWDRTIFTTAEDESGFAIQTNDGCYLIANSTAADPGGYVTQPCWAFEDYWIIKFCDTTSTTGINLLSQNENGFSVYPNPFSNSISIDLKMQNVNLVSIKIYDVLGQSVFEMDDEKFTYTYQKKIDLNGINSGVYFIEVITNENRIIQKLIKQ